MRGSVAFLAQLPENVNVFYTGRSKTGTSRNFTLDLGQADFSLLRTLTDRVPWESVLKGEGVLEGWMCFKKALLNIQKQALPTCRETCCQRKRLSWLNRELQLELREENRKCWLWKEGQVTCEDYKDVTTSCSEKIRKAQSQLKLDLAPTVKD